MVRLDYECDNGHQFERLDRKAVEHPKCPKCGVRADILWLASESPHRQLRDPIVMFRYADGKLGPAGHRDARTPQGAERIEIRSMGEYRSTMRELNAQSRAGEARKDERFMEHYERQESERRGRLTWLMGQESDPAARQVYREALEQRGDPPRADTREWFCEAMEYDRGRRD